MVIWTGIFYPTMGRRRPRGAGYALMSVPSLGNLRRYAPPSSTPLRSKGRLLRKAASLRKAAFLQRPPSSLRGRWSATLRRFGPQRWPRHPRFARAPRRLASASPPPSLRYRSARRRRPPLKALDFGFFSAKSFDLYHLFFILLRLERSVSLIY